MFLWEAKDLSNKDRKSLRINVEFDYATHVKWSPDCKAFVIHKFNENCLEVYKVEKKKDGWLTASKAVTFPKVSMVENQSWISIRSKFAVPKFVGVKFILISCGYDFEIAERKTKQTDN